MEKFWLLRGPPCSMDHNAINVRYGSQSTQSDIKTGPRGSSYRVTLSPILSIDLWTMQSFKNRRSAAFGSSIVDRMLIRHSMSSNCEGAPQATFSQFTWVVRRPDVKGLLQWKSTSVYTSWTYSTYHLELALDTFMRHFESACLVCHTSWAKIYLNSYSKIHGSR